MAEDNLFSIHILGDSFSIKVDEDPEYMQSLIRYVEQKIDETEKTTRLKNPLRIAVLSGILIADELFKAKQKLPFGFSEHESKEAARMTHEIMELIDKSLET